jgi:hypothetical protein
MARVRFLGLVFSFALAIASGIFAGCNSAPTLPLPPPVTEVSVPNTQGLVEVTGQVNSRAFVVVFNERTESGVITRSDLKGDFSVEIEAAIGDLLTIWQESDADSGERKQTVVPAKMD